MMKKQKKPKKNMNKKLKRIPAKKPIKQLNPGWIDPYQQMLIDKGYIAF